MGAYKNTYVGPYLKIPHKKENTKVWKNINPQTGSNYSLNVNFDPVDGTKLVKSFTMVENLIQFDFYSIDLTPDLREDLFFSPADTVNNNINKTFIYMDDDFKCFSLDDVENLELSTIDICGELKRFTEQVKPYLELIYQQGFEVFVKWGVVNFVH